MDFQAHQRLASARPAAADHAHQQPAVHLPSPPRNSPTNAVPFWQTRSATPSGNHAALNKMLSTPQREGRNTDEATKTLYNIDARPTSNSNHNRFQPSGGSPLPIRTSSAQPHAQPVSFFGQMPAPTFNPDASGQKVGRFVPNAQNQSGTGNFDGIVSREENKESCKQGNWRY